MAIRFECLRQFDRAGERATDDSNEENRPNSPARAPQDKITDESQRQIERDIDGDVAKDEAIELKIPRVKKYGERTGIAKGLELPRVKRAVENQQNDEHEQPEESAGRRFTGRQSSPHSTVTRRWSRDR